MLEVVSDAELDRFLGRLLQKAGRGQMTSALGKPLGSVIKGAARVALPFAGRALGRLAPTSQDAGQSWDTRAATLFGIELEGLSPEDQEFQAARRFVRFATDAARQALALERRIGPARAARAGAASAARRYAPGLLRPRPKWPKPRPRPPRRRRPIPAPVADPGPPIVVQPTLVQPPFDEPIVMDGAPSQPDCSNCRCPKCATPSGGWHRQGRDLVVVNVFPDPEPVPIADQPSA